MVTEAEIRRKVRELREVQVKCAAFKFHTFLSCVDDNYSCQWFHKLIANKCQQLLNGTLGTNRLMLFVPPQHGKALDIETPVWTTTGWKKHGELKAGDYVFGQDGKPKKVIANTGAYIWKCQRINFAGGLSLIAAPEHEWVYWADHDDRKGRVFETQETQNIFTRRHRRNPYIDVSPALQGMRTKLPFDPYILGIWLGDGISAMGYIVSGKQDIEYYRTLNIGAIRKDTNNKNGYIIRVPNLFHYIRTSGLLRNKHIPKEYLLADENSRWALLQGLMDTDGCCDVRGNCEFTQKAGQLAEDVYTLLRTLGIKARKANYTAKLGEKECGVKTRILFNPNRQDPIFRMPRKAARLKGKIKNDRSDKLKFFIKSVEDIEQRMVNCIEVEGGMYLAGKDMIPTHNSEVVSRKFPAWALGVNPMLKIVGCSYSADLAQQFSRSIQRTIDSTEYGEVFPNTFLNNQRVKGDTSRGWVRNVDNFETVGYGGFYKAVGVGGSLTGTPADIGIIDDPIKDALEANSETYRNRIWDWYTDVFLTRLHNDSKQILIQTRWHADDLAGRLIEREGDKWTIINIPAICEQEGDGGLSNRKVGEALWEDKHSAERLHEIEQRSPRTFAALYQQRPTIAGGNIVKREWFKSITQSEFYRIHNTEPIVFFIDTAYTDKSDNDPTGIIATCKIGNDLYISHATKVQMRFPDLLRFIPRYVNEHGYTFRSTIRIEPKANGISVIDQMKETTGLNVTQTPSPRDSKETRLNAASPTVECGRVILVDGAWNEQFIDEVCGFPTKPHDEYVDVLCYAIDYHISSPFKPIDKARVASMIY